MPYGDGVGAPAEPSEHRAKPGPKPRFTRERLTEIALSIVDRDGFDALSLRAVARELGVTPMALYTYVASSDELAAMVIEQLVAAKAPRLRASRSWQQTVRSFATSLAELVSEHPALLQAYARGAVTTPAALRVAEQVLTQLEAGGLSRRVAAETYAAVHSLVLGHMLLQSPSSQSIALAVDSRPLPKVTAALRAGHRPGQIPLAQLIKMLIDGIEVRSAP